MKTFKENGPLVRIEKGLKKTSLGLRDVIRARKGKGNQRSKLTRAWVVIRLRSRHPLARGFTSLQWSREERRDSGDKGTGLPGWGDTTQTSAKISHTTRKRETGERFRQHKLKGAPFLTTGGERPFGRRPLSWLRGLTVEQTLEKANKTSD